MIHAEARGESRKGQIAVAQCAVDRYFNGNYGDTLKLVVTAKDQFAISNSYDDDHMGVAIEVLNGAKAFKNCEILYFRKSTSDDDWFAPYIRKIGQHRFYGYEIDIIGNAKTTTIRQFNIIKESDVER